MEGTIGVSMVVLPKAKVTGLGKLAGVGYGGPGSAGGGMLKATVH